MCGKRRQSCYPLRSAPEALVADEANNCSGNRIPPAPSSIDWEDDIIPPPPPTPPPRSKVDLRSSFVAERYRRSANS